MVKKVAMSDGEDDFQSRVEDAHRNIINQTSAHEPYTSTYLSALTSVAAGATIGDLMPFQSPEHERVVVDSVKNDEEAMKEYRNYLKWRYTAVRKIFRNKNIISVIILCITVLLLGFGCFMSYKQLTDPILQQLAQSQTEINLFRIVQFKSSIVGIVILGFSFLFFYMYLKHVFTKVSEPPVHLGEIKREIKTKNHKGT